MKGYLSGMALMLLSTCATATQLEIKNIDYRYPGSTENQYRLPWLTSTDNPEVAKRINDFIFSRLLQQLPGNNPQDTLNRLAKAGIDATANLDYAVEYRDDKILTLSILAEGCGAYCESYTVPMSFDLASGAHITLTDLVSRGALDELNTHVRKDIRNQINVFVDQHKSQSAGQIREEKDEDIDYADFYASCATYTDGLFYVNSFSLQKDTLLFLNGRCSNHANRALDELGDFTTKIPAATLRNQLTPYGQYLLISDGKKTVSPPAGLSGKLRYGTLGKSMRIVLNVSCEYEHFNGAYYYEKFGAPIDLTGKCSPENTQHYELTAMADAVVKEKITLDLKDGHYQGVWESDGKTLPVRVE